MALGFVFIAIKLAEYIVKAQAGIGLETDTFFTLYFLLTGFHLLHVVLGIVILAAVALADSAEEAQAAYTERLIEANKQLEFALRQRLLS